MDAIDIGGAAVPSFGDDAGGDDAEHVEFGDEVGGAALGEAVVADFFAEFVVEVVDLPGGEGLVGACFFVLFVEEEDGVEDEFGLVGERADDFGDAVEFDLFLGLFDVVPGDTGRSVAFGEFGGDPEEVQGSSCVAVFLGAEGGAEWNDVVVGRVFFEGGLGAVVEDVFELGGVVGGEDHAFFAEAGADAGVEEFGEFEVVADADDADAGVLQLGVDPGEVVEGVVALEFVDFVEDDDDDAFFFVDHGFEFGVDFVGGPAGEGDVVVPFAHELVGDVLEEAVVGVDDGAVEVDEVDVGAELVAFFPQFLAEVFDDGGLAGAGFAVDEDVGGGFAFEGGGEDVSEAVDLFGAVGEVVGYVGGPHDFAVQEQGFVVEVLVKNVLG